jgi:hypothetical protein
MCSWSRVSRLRKSVSSILAWSTNLGPDIDPSRAGHPSGFDPLKPGDEGQAPGLLT